MPNPDTNSIFYKIGQLTKQKIATELANVSSGATGYTQNIGDNSATTINVTHNLNSDNLLYSIRDVSTNEFVQTETVIVDANTIRFVFYTAPTTNQYHVTIISTDGSGGGSGGGGTNFLLQEINTSGNSTQSSTYTHVLYDASSGNIIMDLLSPTSHQGVTQHKRIDSSANTVTLSAPSGSTIDGSQTYTLDTQYESIGLFSDGTNYFIQ